MSAKRPPVGMKHLTVVPENAERPERPQGEDDGTERDGTERTDST